MQPGGADMRYCVCAAEVQSTHVTHQLLWHNSFLHYIKLSHTSHYLQVITLHDLLHQPPSCDMSILSHISPHTNLRPSQHMAYLYQPPFCTVACQCCLTLHPHTNFRPSQHMAFLYQLPFCTVACQCCLTFHLHTNFRLSYYMTYLH